MIKMSISTKETGTTLWDSLKKVIASTPTAYVTIGIHEDAGQYTKGANPPSVVQVALWNEFGTEHIPQRSFFRSAIDENIVKIEALRDKMVTNILINGWKPERALEAIGLFVQTLIQNKIKSNVGPAYGTGMGNSPETIARAQAEKQARVGHTQTLRESELMLRSIIFRVHVGD